MNVLKRVEVWMLLLAMAGGLFFVLRDSGSRNDTPLDDDDDAGTSSPGSVVPGSEASVVIAEIRAKRDYGNVLLELAVEIDNSRGAELELVAPVTQVLAGPAPSEAHAVEPFFLAFSRPPLVAAGQRDSVELKYWLEPGDLDAGLWLQVRSERIPIKNPGASFDLESIENQATVRFPDPAWTNPIPIGK